MGKTGLMALVNTRPELKKYFTTKGTLRKGTKKIDIGIEFVIYAKIDQISKSRKLTMWKAWEQLTQHRNFHALMRPHFQRMKKYKNKTAWRNVIRDPDWIKTFYKNNLVRSRLKERISEIKFTY
jgi:nicotinic acid mononucleotide adenylyltransferase|tara:strand:+ start:37 stop:408 length:372 start_codon:yes stop_codon:yes gene_type:complete